MLVAVKQAVQDSSYQVFYQPIMNVQTGEFETAEALARLIAPDLGFIPPDVFIQKAERSGDIVRIGEIILEKGDSIPAEELYRMLMGRDPNPDAFMKVHNINR